MRVGFFFNSDGDSAEITRRAMNQYRTSFLGNNSLLAQAGLENAGTATKMNFQLDLPSSFVDWQSFADSPGSAIGFRNQAMQGGASPDDTAPGSAWPASPPQDVILPSIPLPIDKTPVSKVPGNEAKTASLEALTPPGECKTCASRRYVDKSDDPSVSYQTPTNISASMSTAAVASHENEHVSNERAKADRDGREIINQTVNLTYDCCPECGRTYVSGGTTRTTSTGKSGDDKPEFQAIDPGSSGNDPGE